MRRVRQDDQVQILAGKDRGQRGPVTFATSMIGAQELIYLIADEPELAHLAHKTLGNMVEAAGDAMADALTAAGRPLRRISIEDLDERRIGGLLMHFMLETIIAAELLGVDPFDQPAVEAVKVRVRATLAEAGSG